MTTVDNKGAPVRRWIYRIFCVVCVVLLVGAISLWVRSRRTYACDYMAYTFQAPRLGISSVSLESVGGELALNVWKKDVVEQDGWPIGGDLWHDRGEFGWHAELDRWPPYMLVSVLCYQPVYRPRVSWRWIVLGLFAANVVLWVYPVVDRVFTRARRRQRNLCENCGYDLRASSERCPECATPVRVRRPVRGRDATERRPVRGPDATMAGGSDTDGSGRAPHRP